MRSYIRALSVLVVLTGFVSLDATARADLIVLTFPEVNGPENTSGFPLPAVDVGTELFSLPSGAVITSATLSGTFGETSTYYGSTAHHELLINGVSVGSTYDVSPDPYGNVVPFSFSVPTALLTGGSATLSYVQLSQYNVRLSETELTIEYTLNAVPEPSTAVIAGMSLVGLGLFTRFRRRSRHTA